MTPLSELHGMARMLSRLARSRWARIPEDHATATALLCAHRALQIARDDFGMSVRAIGRISFGLCIELGPAVAVGPSSYARDYRAIEEARAIPAGALFEVVALEIKRIIRAIRRGLTWLP